VAVGRLINWSPLVRTRSTDASTTRTALAVSPSASQMWLFTSAISKATSAKPPRTALESASRFASM
jgi:hypothetical protein